MTPKSLLVLIYGRRQAGTKRCSVVTPLQGTEGGTKRERATKRGRERKRKEEEEERGRERKGEVERGS